MYIIPVIGQIPSFASIYSRLLNIYLLAPAANPKITSVIKNLLSKCKMKFVIYMSDTDSNMKAGSLRPLKFLPPFSFLFYNFNFRLHIHPYLISTHPRLNRFIIFRIILTNGASFDASSGEATISMLLKFLGRTTIPNGHFYIYIGSSLKKAHSIKSTHF